MKRRALLVFAASLGVSWPIPAAAKPKAPPTDVYTDIYSDVYGRR